LVGKSLARSAKKGQRIMAPIKVGRLSVEITVNNIDGFLQEMIELPAGRGFWVTFSVRDEAGKTESYPLVDSANKVKVFQSYQEALYDAAQKLKVQKKF
jgi:hypothetical protein